MASIVPIAASDDDTAFHAQPQSSSASPATKLYRHALESIFKFCALKELHAILAVCRDWSSAVGAMPTIGLQARAATIDRLTLIAHSRLARHVTRMLDDCVDTLAGLRILADRMPWIEHAWFDPPAQGAFDSATEALVLSRFSRIKWLYVNLRRPGMDLTIESMNQHAVAANHMIKAAACMPQLEGFWIRLMCHDERISLAPLTALTRLRTFIFPADNLQSALPSDEQVAALRQMHSLETFSHNFSNRNAILRLLLQPPTPPLRWTWAPVASGASDLVPQLLSLPDLTALDVECGSGDVEFLVSLPRVLSLTLYSTDVDIGPAYLTRVVTTLQGCSQLTSLSLNALAFTSVQLAALLASLRPLSHLWLDDLPELISLSFLATDALASSLTSLAVCFCRKVPSDEIVNLLGLRSLQRIDVGEWREPLSEAQQAQLQSAHPRATLLCK